MQYIEIKGKPTLCYMVKSGEVNDIVIPVHFCSPVDLRRLNEIEAKGGEMLSRMRDHTIDNGVNALAQYKDLLVVVAKPKVVKPAVVAERETGEVVEEPKKRRGGRPKKNPV